EAELKGHSDWVISSVFSPDSQHIVSASADHTAHRVQQLVNKSLDCAQLPSRFYICFCQCYGDLHHFTNNSLQTYQRIWNTDTGECEAELKGHSGWINSAIFSPDGMHIVSASDDLIAQTWN
ncbi:WD40 repeat-like protein, partial [Phlegmacium glaucopus]